MVQWSVSKADSKHPFDKSYKTITEDKQRPTLYEEKYKPNSLHKRTAHSPAQ